MNNIGYRIYKNFDRVSNNIIQKFKDIPTSNIGDCMNRTAALHSSLKPLNDVPLLGSAYTVNVPSGDNLLIYYAIDNAQEGDVIVVSGSGYTGQALCGEIMAELALKRKLGGLVIWGAIRDEKYLKEMPFPVYAVGTTCNGPFKNGPGSINIPVSMGNQIVYPGDIIIGDDSGIVSIRPFEAEGIYEKAVKVIEKEAGMLKSIRETGKLDLTWMYDKLKADNCEIIEN